MRYRLLLPDWAQKSSPALPKAVEGDDYTVEFLKDYNNAGYGIYYFPNHNKMPTNDPYLKGRAIDVWNCVYVDMDIKDGKYASKEAFVEKLLQFDPQPNKFVLSGNGVHAYWNISDLTRDRFLTLQLQLIKTFDTDKSIWNLARIMRMEGYYNTKNPEDFKMVDALVAHDRVIAFADLTSQLRPLDETEELKVANTLKKTDGLLTVKLEEDIDLDTLPEPFVKWMEKNERVKYLMTSWDADRSKRAYALAQMMAEKGINKFDAIAVIANHPKCMHRPDRLHYATVLVDGAYQKGARYTVPNIAERLKQYKSEPPRAGTEVHGPDYFDANAKKWRTGQVLGLVGGTGIGKSTVSLDIFKHMIINNPDSKDIYVYFNLEMSEFDIIERWGTLVGKDSDMNNRLYVVSNEDAQGNPLHLSLQDISWYCRDIAKVSGRKIAAICIDHIAVINPAIDITKEPSFGMVADMEGAFGNFRNVNARKMPQLLKELAKQLDCFIIIQSQTSKARGGQGDTPLGVEAAIGASQFEHYIDYLITLCQPIRRVYWKTPLRILGWQYVKNRHLSKGDGPTNGGVATYDQRVLAVDLETGALRMLDEAEIEEVKKLSEECEVLRKKEDKKCAVEIKNSPGIAKLKQIMILRSIK